MPSVAEEKLPEHPRILFTKQDEFKLKQRIKQDALAAELYEEMRQRADMILEEPTCRYEIPDGLRLLGQCRLALSNILHSSMAWRLSGEKKYFDRAVLEMDAACGLQDWNTKHFLDVAEMSTAVAIGYDWLYPDLTDEQRQRYAQALREKGLETARARFGKKNRRWTDPYNNWEQVCATGLLFAERALEKEGEEVHPSRKVAVMILDRCRRFYQPDGAYPEGPDYWHYGSNYHVLGLALQRGGQRDLEISTPGEFRASALFSEYLTGPTGKVFNFFDAGNARRKITPAQCWMVREFLDPIAVNAVRSLLAEEIRKKSGSKARGRDRFFPLHLVWLPEKSERSGELPLDKMWHGTQPLATFRSAWRDPDALYFAIKGGYPKASHGQMDIGTFVLDCDGVRWVEDLGKDNYNLPAYFGSKRWDYFRLTNKAHSTLVIDGQLQNLQAESCPIDGFTSSDREAGAVVDLGEVYEGQAQGVKRHCLFDRVSKLVSLADVIDKPVGDVRWAIVTRAQVKISGAKVLLTQDGKAMEVIRKDREGGEWKVLDATPPTAEENQNKGVSILAFTVPKKDKLELKVDFRPVR